jgi:hypothetical protein
MDHKPNDTETRSNPHKYKHIRPETRTDLQSSLRCNDIAENNEHDSRDDRRGCCQESGNERPNGNWEAPPPRKEHDGSDEYRDEIHANTGQEEAKHDMASNLDEIQNVVDIRRQRNCGAGKKLIEKDIDGIEPVECFRGRAIGYAFAVVALAEIPQADLVEIVEAEGAGERVDEDCVGGCGCRDYVAEIELEKVGASDYGLFVYIADYSLPFLLVRWVEELERRRGNVRGLGKWRRLGRGSWLRQWHFVVWMSLV